jgi:hypothetical protein
MRVPPIEEKDAPLILRPFFALMRRRLGKLVRPWKAWAYRPGPTLWFGAFMISLESSKILPEQTKRLVCLRAAQLIGCVF